MNYDIVGDIHGQAEKLSTLLQRLDVSGFLCAEVVTKNLSLWRG